MGRPIKLASDDPVGRDPWASQDASKDAARALADDLARAVRGEVRFDRGSRALYATDASNYRQVPIGVVLPRDVDDLIAAVAICRRHGAPLLPRGGGTSLAGQCCNVAVVLDLSKYLTGVLAIDQAGRRATVQPGAALDQLRTRTVRHGLTFGPDPSTHRSCTIGGMIGNNSCGVHSVMSQFYGPGPRMSDNVTTLDVLTYDGTRLRVGPTSEDELRRIIAGGRRRGEIYRRLAGLRDRYAGLIRARMPDLPRRVSGFNLDDLLPEKGFNVARALVGSEGTCVTVLEATLHLVAEPKARSLLVLGYPDVYAAADRPGFEDRGHLIGLEGMDEQLVRFMERRNIASAHVRQLPEGRGWLLVELGGDSREEARDRAHALMSALRRGGAAPAMELFESREQQEAIWTIRESGLGATAFVPGEPDAWEGWEDAAVPPDRVGRYLREFRELLRRYGYKASLYGHFGQGCVHTRIPFDLRSEEGIRQFRRFVDEAADLVLSHGGSLSGEHGDGQARAELLPRMFGPELVEAFREFKAIWDPDWKMNPGKVVDADRITENLRLGASYQPASPPTHFAYAGDRGSFARAALRCVGVGQCRKVESGTMCPSYMVTREEMHSTRGRARLLFEMLEGQVLTDGWRDEHVKEALDLCLSCKGCLDECPVSVDMATYKAEFYAHYYEGRMRPLFAYATGLIDRWASLASIAPGVANLLVRAPGLRQAAAALLGIAPRRQPPPFARDTLKAWFRRRRSRVRSDAPSVVLWPDTFTNHLHPEIGRAAVTVLEAAGYRVRMPAAALCCGRPLYEFGMLDLAKRRLQEILRALREPIAAGLPIVGLEPSCVAVFRDELVNLLPDDAHARRLADQTVSLGELLAAREGVPAAALRRRALVHGHCHQKALWGTGRDVEVLERLGVDVEPLDAGCCGMAGAFGFDRRHYGVSVQVGERVLLPAVRQAARDTLIVADGFSCRTQIADTTDRRALHLAQVLQMALSEGPDGPAGDCPESGRTGRPATIADDLPLLGAVAAATAVGGVLWRGLRPGNGPRREPPASEAKR